MIQIHHIIPWSQTRQHNPSDMIALCPTHHYRADMREYSEACLRELKSSPHNQRIVSDAFIIQSEELMVSVASNRFVNIPRILVVDDFDIISITKINQCPHLNVNFFDILDRWIALVHQNQWYVDRRFVWDIEYRPKHLILRCRPRRISLEVRITNDVIFLRGDLYFNGYTIEATENDLFLGGRSALTMRGSTFANAPVGISLSTGRTPFSRISARIE